MSTVSDKVQGRKAVLVTGCSSGIGQHTAVTLATHGFVVFATVRKHADADRLRSLGLANLVPVCPLDVTDHQQIAEAVDTVKRELERRACTGLYALVNNAGGGTPAPIELIDLEQFRTELHTRVLGSVAMVQACLPLVRLAHGRLVWIMTPALIPTPYVAAIHACDFAVNCLARTLNIELKGWNIPNVMITCGGIRTPAGLRTAADVEALLQQGPRELVRLYEPALRRWAADMVEFDKRRTDPDRVAQTVLAALTASRPKRRYSVGYMASAARVLEALPQSLADWVLARRF